MSGIKIIEILLKSILDDITIFQKNDYTFKVPENQCQK